MSGSPHGPHDFGTPQAPASRRHLPQALAVRDGQPQHRQKAAAEPRQVRVLQEVVAQRPGAVGGVWKNPWKSRGFIWDF